MGSTLFPAGKLIIYTDGGARGNPGPAAIGVVIGDRKYGEKIGDTTNNVAEYKAVVFALKKSKHLLGKKRAKETDLEINVDSELIYKQVNGQYKILEPELQEFFIQIWNLKQDFKSVEFRKIPREQNKAADRLVNKALGGKEDGKDEEGQGEIVKWEDVAGLGDVKQALLETLELPLLREDLMKEFKVKPSKDRKMTT